MNACMFSSATDDWETPIALFNELDAEFHFDLDVCATAQNRKCSSFFSIEEDGLKQKWGGAVLDEPAIRTADRRVGAQGIRVNTGHSGACSVLATIKDRYKLVA